MAEKNPIVVLEESDGTTFQDKCRMLVKDGYRLNSSSCGFVQSEAYDFCSSWHAVFVLPSAWTD